jgi:hypothetical protein
MQGASDRALSFCTKTVAKIPLRQDLFPVFLRVPQEVPVVHSFFTPVVRFFVAARQLLKQSAHIETRDVSCLEHCGGISGSGKFSRVNLPGVCQHTLSAC